MRPRSIFFFAIPLHVWRGNVTRAEITVNEHSNIKCARNFQPEMRLQNKHPGNEPGFFARTRAASEMIVQTKAQKA